MVKSLESALDKLEKDRLDAGTLLESSGLDRAYLRKFKVDQNHTRKSNLKFWLFEN